MTSKPWIALAALVAAGCSTPERTAGGGGIEIPNGIVVTVRDSTGSAVAGARVRVLAADAWAARLATGSQVVLDSGLTDAQGTAHLAHHDEATWIEVEGRGGAARLSSRDGSALSGVLAPTTALAGQIPSTDPRASRMRLAGTDLVANVDSQGRFSFPKVIRGDYGLVADGIGSRDRVPAGRAVVGVSGTASVHLDTTGLLIDDFSDGDVSWSLQGFFGATYWWLNADVPVDSLPRVFGVATTTQALQGAGSDRWLGIAVSKAVLSPAWSNFGLDLGAASPRLPSMSRLAAVRVRLRGTGSWTLRLATDSAGVSDTWIADLVLDTAWTEVRIPASSFATARNAALSLPAPIRLRNLVFQTAGEGRLDVDDIVLEGPSLEDWTLR